MGDKNLWTRPLIGLPWWVHIVYSSFAAAISLAVWWLYLAGPITQTGWYALIGFHAEGLGFFLSVTEVRYAKRGVETPLAYVAVAFFVAGLYASTAANLPK